MAKSCGGHYTRVHAHAHTNTPHNTKHAQHTAHRYRRGRHTVFVVGVADDFRPEHASEVPLGFTSIHPLEARLPLVEAISVAKQYNRQQLADGLQSRLWALVAFRAKAPKGGAV